MPPTAAQIRASRADASRESTDSERVRNAFSVDVEDYFHAATLQPFVPRQEWDGCESRVHSNTQQLLDLFAAHGVKATLFVLGWVAERFPRLVRDICQAGHELALHGYDHRSITEQSREEFQADIRRSKSILEDLTGIRIIGYRAPNFSVVRETLWALEILAEEGFRYDSSVFPIRHDRYGIPDFSRFPEVVSIGTNGSIVEFPISTVRIAGINLPFTGGGYLRHLPFAVNRWGIRRLNRRYSQPALVYIHPWEIDTGQPRIGAGRLSTFRHYRNLSRVKPRLEALFSEFSFTTVQEVLGL